MLPSSSRLGLQVHGPQHFTRSEVTEFASSAFTRAYTSTVSDYVLQGNITGLFGISGLTEKLYSLQSSDPDYPIKETVKPDFGGLVTGSISQLFPSIDSETIQNLPIKNIEFAYSEEVDAFFNPAGLSLNTVITFTGPLQPINDLLRPIYSGRNDMAPTELKVSATLSAERDWSLPINVADFVIRGSVDQFLSLGEVINFRKVGVEVSAIEAQDIASENERWEMGYGLFGELDIRNISGAALPLSVRYYMRKFAPSRFRLHIVPKNGLPRPGKQQDILEGSDSPICITREESISSFDGPHTFRLHTVEDLAAQTKGHLDDEFDKMTVATSDDDLDDKPAFLTLILVFLDLLSRHQISRSFAPNFFLARLVSALKGAEASLQGGDWDLSTLNFLASGGEANDVATCVAATELFQRYGAPEHVITPGFGMTETCAGAIYNLECPQATLDVSGHHHLTGRAKDVININNIKVETADVQMAVEQALGALVTRVVVFPAQTADMVMEQVVVAYIPRNRDPEADMVAIEDLAVTESNYDPVVTLVPPRTPHPDNATNKTPLWLVHPGVGEVLIFLNLAHHLAALEPHARSVYAVRARGFELNQTRVSSISETASAYIAAIRSRQPQGPYALAGCSYGTMLTFEVAKVLQETSSVLFLGNFNLPPHIKHCMRQLNWNMVFISNSVAELGLTRAALARWADVANGLQNMAVDYEPRGKLRWGMDVFHAVPLRTAAASREEWLEVHLKRWEDFVEPEEPHADGGVRFHAVGGEHYTMVGPEFVEGFAGTLVKALAERDDEYNQRKKV
ncbi:Alpha/Beta hydrolase protein [Immersiella caudata]|uniref:Alpha/Beta hydrolase protein n=1 Tax=Immersiella caudata TaxID=314043 RepID=A0AA39X293_9PEZI|nr:Alpha/Beta hydrolase protein [Immersiella caudata]